MLAEQTVLISGTEKGLEALTSFLKSAGCRSVTVLSSGSEARQMHMEYDLCIINAPLKDEFGTDLAIKLSTSTFSGIIFLCKADFAEEMESLLSLYGIFVLPLPLNKNLFLRAIRVALGTRRRALPLCRENEKLHAKLEETCFVDRAKFYLMEKERMTEAVAHRHIEKRAMDRRRTKREIAQEIIAKYS